MTSRSKTLKTKDQLEAKKARRVFRPTRSRGFHEIPGYKCNCGWCGKVTQVVTDGRMRVCGECGR